MIYFDKRDYSASFFLLEEKAGSNFVVNTEYGHRLTRFENMPLMYGDKFESIELLGHNLVGFMGYPSKLMVEESDAVFMDYLDNYRKYKRKSKTLAEVELTFEDYLKINLEIVRKSRYSRILPFIAWTYEGAWVFYYFENGELKCEVLTESCFINNGFITPLSVAARNAVNKLERDKEDLLKHIERIQTKEHELDRNLSYSILPRFVARR